MGQRYGELTPDLTRFIWEQNMFFVASAPAEGHVNVSPKGLDTLRVVDSKTVAWLNVTGSGNETAAHVRENGRMTLMFCAFTGRPMILRLYGQARVIHPRGEDWSEWRTRFDDLPGARQIFILDIELVQTSCGMAVPLFDFNGQRQELIDWADKKGADGIAEYWTRKNQQSLDGKPTGIFGDGEKSSNEEP